MVQFGLSPKCTLYIQGVLPNWVFFKLCSGLKHNLRFYNLSLSLFFRERRHIPEWTTHPHNAASRYLGYFYSREHLNNPSVFLNCFPHILCPAVTPGVWVRAMRLDLKSKISSLDNKTLTTYGCEYYCKENLPELLLTDK